MKGAVATGHELTAEAACEVLRAGGNAFDAAVAALATTCVVEPVLASLAGGGFLLARPARGRARLYDFFVHTPRTPRPGNELDFRPIQADFGTATQEFHIGVGTATTPGVTAGLFRMHEELATLPLSELLAPAVRHAAEGVAVNHFQASIFDIVGPIYRDRPETLAHYGGSAGELVREGDRLRQPALADTLETLAIEGEALFYRGEIAAALLSLMEEGGQLTAEDLSNYQVLPREPLSADYRGVKLITNPPPSSGGLLLAFALELLAGSPMPEPHGSPAQLLHLADTMALTNEARLATHLEESGPHPDAGRLLNGGFVRRYREALANRAISRRGTTHISILDAEGNAASLTLSNGEGCGRLIPGTGIMLNNMLGEEDLNPHGFHQWPRDTRMTSMMAPLMAFDVDSGRTVVAGSGGSNRIRTALLQLLVNLFDFDLEAHDAVEAPRIHVEGELLSVEGGFDVERLGALLSAWPEHQLWPGRSLFFGGAHTVVHQGGAFSGAGDSRRGGVYRAV